MEPNTGENREVCSGGSCVIDAEVMASVEQIGSDEQLHLESRVTPPCRYCFEHLVELVENLSEGGHVSAIGKTESGERDNSTKMRPGVMVIATPALEHRLDDLLATA